MNKKLYVGNLSYDVKQSDLETLFNEQGEVSSVNLITDQYTGRAKGFGFIEMENGEDAQKAQESLDGQEFLGRNMKVNFAIERNDNQGRRESRDRY